MIILGLLIGFTFFKLVSGKHEGDKLENSLRFQIGRYYLHIHHWIWCSLLLTLFLTFGFKNYFLLGFLVGAVIQGLLYRDRFVIFYPKNKFKEIYSKFK